MVFDTAEGFQGVWHLAAIETDTAYDATVNQYHGVPFSTSGNSSVPGPAGIGRSFNGTACLYTPQTAGRGLSVSPDDPATISAWVFIETADTGLKIIASQGDAPAIVLHGTGQDWYAGLMVLSDSASAPPLYFESAGMPVRLGKWYHIAGVVDGSARYLYINGSETLSGGDAAVDFATMLPSSGADFTIGGFVDENLSGDPAGTFFNGIIDEVRFSNVARSAGWIRLCHANQQSVDSLLVFDPE
jgi:hypothetical protein